MNDTLEKVIEGYLEDYTIDDLLEELDVDPLEAMVVLFEAGLIDEEKLLVHLEA